MRGTGDLGVVVERAAGRLQIVETTGMTRLATVDGLGDLSHASVVFSRDARYAYVFGRDGGLTRVDLLTARITDRILQAGNSIGGAISQDGRVVAAQNYAPGGIRLFDAQTRTGTRHSGGRQAASRTTPWSRPLAAGTWQGCSAKTA